MENSFSFRATNNQWVPRLFYFSFHFFFQNDKQAVAASVIFATVCSFVCGLVTMIVCAAVAEPVYTKLN
jgi:hypothetical protein